MPPKPWSARVCRAMSRSRISKSRNTKRVHAGCTKCRVTFNRGIAEAGYGIESLCRSIPESFAEPGAVAAHGFDVVEDDLERGGYWNRQDQSHPTPEPAPNQQGHGHRERVQ